MTVVEALKTTQLLLHILHMYYIIAYGVLSG